MLPPVSAAVTQRGAPATASAHFTLVLVDATTGARVTGHVAWAPFFAALCQLCEELGIVVECESVEDESVALFWQAPVCAGEHDRFTGECQASTA
jgi:hypothetical protein